MNKNITLRILLLCFLQISHACEDRPGMANACLNIKKNRRCRKGNTFKLAKMYCKKTCSYCKATKINGAWSSWSKFGPCIGSCGDVFKTRSRSCTNPSPAGGGARCPGSSTSTKLCYKSKCPINGAWSIWTSYGKCSPCESQSGIQVRNRLCDSPVPKYGGIDCVGKSKQAIKCHTPCPINGGWNRWGPYAACVPLGTKRCGNGKMVRIRQCVHPVPKYGGKNCVGSALESKECFLGSCANHLDIDGGWTQWTLWGPCIGVPCGSGKLSFAYQTRSCTNPKPQYNGKPCAKQWYTKKKMQCMAPLCPIDGGYSEWAAQGFCSRTCGEGMQMFTRNCTKPKPMYDGKPCKGANSKLDSCVVKPCPESYWLAWGTWSSCRPDCGRGVLTRVRECKRTTRSNCKGLKTSTMKCRTFCSAVLKNFTVKILTIFPSTLDSSAGETVEMSTLWTVIGMSILPILTYIIVSVCVYFDDIIAYLEKLKETAATFFDKTRENVLRKKDDSEFEDLNNVEGRAFLYNDNSGDRPSSLTVNRTSLTLVQPKGDVTYIAESH